MQAFCEGGRLCLHFQVCLFLHCEVFFRDSVCDLLPLELQQAITKIPDSHKAWPRKELEEENLAHACDFGVGGVPGGTGGDARFQLGRHRARSSTGRGLPQAQ